MSNVGGFDIEWPVAKYCRNDEYPSDVGITIAGCCHYSIGRNGAKKALHLNDVLQTFTKLYLDGVNGNASAPSEISKCCAFVHVLDRLF